MSSQYVCIWSNSRSCETFCSTSCFLLVFGPYQGSTNNLLRFGKILLLYKEMKQFLLSCSCNSNCCCHYIGLMGTLGNCPHTWLHIGFFLPTGLAQDFYHPHPFPIHSIASFELSSIQYEVFIMFTFKALVFFSISRSNVLHIPSKSFMPSPSHLSTLIFCSIFGCDLDFSRCTSLNHTNISCFWSWPLSFPTSHTWNLGCQLWLNLFLEICFSKVILFGNSTSPYYNLYFFSVLWFCSSPLSPFSLLKTNSLTDPIIHMV